MVREKEKKHTAPDSGRLKESTNMWHGTWTGKNSSGTCYCKMKWCLFLSWQALGCESLLFGELVISVS
jgi:hypothetical protein